jgi:hypothetical protein
MTLIRVRETTPIKITGSPGATSASADDRVFAINNTNQLVMSTDRGENYGTTKGLPANVDGSKVARVTRWKNKIWLVGYDTVTTRVGLYSAAPAPVLNDPFSWSGPLQLLTVGSTTAFAMQVGTSEWGVAQDALIVSDYGPDPTGGPSMWRTTDGTTFTQVLGPIAATRHIHAVWADPYRQGHWWMTCGDGTGHQFYRSTDYGVTWTRLTTGANGVDLTASPWQAVQISADADALYFASDSQQYTVMKMRRSDIDAGIYRPILAPVDHRRLQLPNARPARGPFTDGVTTAGSKNFTSATANFTADDVGRYVSFPKSTNPGGYPLQLRIYIASVTNSTTAVLNPNGQANQSTTAIEFLLSAPAAGGRRLLGVATPRPSATRQGQLRAALK